MEEFRHGCARIVEHLDAFGRMRFDVFIDAFVQVVNSVSAGANRVENQWSLGFDPVGDSVGVIEVGEGYVHLVQVLEFDQEVAHNVFHGKPAWGERLSSDSFEEGAQFGFYARYSRMTNLVLGMF